MIADVILILQHCCYFARRRGSITLSKQLSFDGKRLLSLRGGSCVFSGEATVLVNACEDFVSSSRGGLLAISFSFTGKCPTRFV